MVNLVQTTLLVLAVASGASCQYFDFFSALQPLLQYTTPRPQHIEYTTKRQIVQNTRGQTRTDVSKRRDNYSVNRDTVIPVAELLYEQTTRRTSNKNIQPILYEEVTRRPANNANRNPGIVYEQTTKRPTVRTTTKKTTTTTRRNISSSNNVRATTRKPNQAIVFQDNNSNNKRPNQSNKQNSNDKIYYQDGKLNTVYNYETTKSYTTKSPFVFEDSYQPNSYVTQNPYKPGVKPAVTNGAPITNKPVTQRPFSKPYEDDTSVTPELIFGPNEDYMSNVDKKRYIELAEKMCDKYKALNIKQVEAIPLLPSPNSVKVNVSSCTPSNVPLVVGGKVVTIQEFPHMALLGWKRAHGSGYYWKCGGSLISDQYILTAGHCAYQDRDNAVISGPPRVVQLGSSFLNDRNAKVVRVAAVYRHPKYKQPKSYYDIAVVKLASPVSFSDSIKPACLGVPPGVGQPIIATGWGRTEFGGDQSNELRSVSLPIWDIDECYDVLGTSRKIPNGPSSDSQICAGEKQGGKDTCQGDSGGPAQVQEGCIWRVTAVTSLGRSCGAPQTPALYALVPRVFVSAIAFDPSENRHKEQRNTNQNYQPNNNREQRNNFNTNNNREQRNNFNTNNNNRNDYDTNSNNQYYNTNNQRQNQDNNNQRNNYNDYTTQRNYYVQDSYDRNPSRFDNGRESQYYNSGTRVFWQK
ncbi:serine protease filzig-like [Aricia agestis]|uniref:serine protease filzig-like n=1 Tax=Aricia agestis TaxID=91739 RepID=UPI001C201E04|nr:serine protease filzig-like [Aricia agestis]